MGRPKWPTVLRTAVQDRANSRDLKDQLHESPGITWNHRYLIDLPSAYLYNIIYIYIHMYG